MWMRSGILLALLTASLSSYGQQGKAPVDTTSKQAASVAAMQAAIDKQKASIAAQIGPGGPADPFFSTPWTAPASITPPAMIAPCDAMQQTDLQPIVTEAATKQGLKPELIVAVIKRESASYPCAVSDKGALGLMQLMPETAQQFGVDPLDPKQNVSAGSQYLKQLLTKYNGDLKLTLAAYNAGPQRVDAGKKVPDIPETTAYVDSILKDLSASAPVRK
jgi:soluble lytic murein transglycosylase-like protein